MKIAIWPADRSGTGHYRLIFPGRALAAEGVEIFDDKVGPAIEWSKPWPNIDKAPEWTHVVNVRPYDADVVVMQRPARMHWAEVIPHLQAQGIRVVVDVDDLFDQIPKGNIAYRDYQKGGRFPAVAQSWVDEACKLADAVTCTTPLLLKRYGHGHGVVLPNLVPESYLSMEQPFKWRQLVGWSGIVGTHPGDLQETDGAIAQALQGTEWGFHTVGPVEGVAEALGLLTGGTTAVEIALGDGRTEIVSEKDAELFTRLPQRLVKVGCELTAPFSSTGYLAFESWASSLAELDVGIVPLGQSLFNEAKSALKVSEMAAMGVPVVMSPTPDNLRVHKKGVGLVAESRGQWQRLVSKLIGSEQLRADLAASGREVMATQTYERHAERWLEVWGGPDGSRHSARPEMAVSGV